MNSSKVKPEHKIETNNSQFGDFSLKSQGNLRDQTIEPSDANYLHNQTISPAIEGESRNSHAQETSVPQLEAKIKDQKSQPTNIPNYDYTQGLNFAQSILRQDQLRETLSAPFDKVELVQILANPNKVGEYITVETVVQQVFPQSSPLLDQEATENISQCLCGQDLQYSRGDEKNCIKCGKMTLKYYENKCGKEACKVGVVCALCHSQRCTEQLVRDKTRNHNAYLEQSINFDGQSARVGELIQPNLKTLPKQQVYTSIKFWNKNGQCTALFYIEEEIVLFQKQFLILGEQDELFYFFKRDENPNYFFSQVNFIKIYEEDRNRNIQDFHTVSKSEREIQNISNLTRQGSTFSEQHLPRLFNGKLIWSACLYSSIQQQSADFAYLLQKIVSIVQDLGTCEQFLHPRCFLYLGKTKNGDLVVGKESWEIISRSEKIRGFSDVRSTYQLIKESDLTSDQYKSDFAPQLQKDVQVLEGALLLAYRQQDNHLYQGTTSVVVNGAKMQDSYLRQNLTMLPWQGYKDHQDIFIGQSMYRVHTQNLKLSISEYQPGGQNQENDPYGEEVIQQKNNAVQVVLNLKVQGVNEELKNVEFVCFLSFDLKESNHTLLVKWTEGNQVYHAVVSSNDFDCQHIVQVGHERVVCAYPLLISKCMKSHNQIMISNLQTNTSQVCLSLGDYTICGLATEHFDDSDQIHWGDRMYPQLGYFKIFALVKAEDHLFQVFAIEIDLFGLNNPSKYQQDSLDDDLKQRYFWEEDLRAKSKQYSEKYQLIVTDCRMIEDLKAKEYDGPKKSSSVFYGDPRSQRFWEMFSVQSTLKYYIIFEQNDESTGWPPKRNQKTVMTSNMLVYVEQYSKGDELYVSAYGNLSQLVTSFEGKTVLDLKLTGSGQVLVITSDYKLHTFEWYKRGSMDQRVNYLPIHAKPIPTDLLKDKFEIISEDESKLAWQSPFQHFDHLVYFDERMMIIKQKGNRGFYRYLFESQKIEEVFVAPSKLEGEQFSDCSLFTEDEILSVCQIQYTELLLLTRKNRAGAKYHHVVPVPSSREITVMSSKFQRSNNLNQTDKKLFDLNFLPNGMVCYSSQAQKVFAFCPKTNMLAFADYKLFRVLDEDQFLFDGQSYYKKRNEWHSYSSIDSGLQEMMMEGLRAKQNREIVSERQILKYSNGALHLVCFVKAEGKVPSRVTFVDLSESYDDLRSECFIVHLNYQDEWQIPTDKKLVATQNFIAWLFQDKIWFFRINFTGQSNNIKKFLTREKYKIEQIKTLKTISINYGLHVLNQEDSKFSDRRGRQNVIQFQTWKDGVTTLVTWDLDQHELVREWDEVQVLTRNGFKPTNLSQNEQCTLIESQQYQNSNPLNYYTRLDLELMMKCLHKPDQVDDIFEMPLLLANFGSRTLLSAFVANTDSQYLKMIVAAVTNMLKQENEAQAQTTILQNIHNVLVLPCEAGTSMTNSELLEFMGLESGKVPQYKQSDTRQNVMQQALKLSDLSAFKLLIQLLVQCPSGQVSLYDLVHECDQLGMLLEVRSQEANQFLEVCKKSTSETQSITELKIRHNQERVSFTYNSPNLSSTEIKQYFLFEIQKPVGFSLFFTEVSALIRNKFKSVAVPLEEFTGSQNFQFLLQHTNLTPVKCSVEIIEIEWLQDSISTFLQVVIQDDSRFDSELVQQLLKELDFWYPIFVLIFIPFLIYFSIVTYYFCFIITDAYQPRKGFTSGTSFALALRILILIFTAYQFALEYFQLSEEGLKQYLNPKKIGRHMKNFMRLLNIWIIVEHSTNFMKIEPTRLSQVASLEQFQLWYNLLEWMRIFDGTAVYVRLIQDTIWNTRYFMIMLVIIICTFGSSFLILDRQVKITKQFEDAQDNYIQVQTATMGYDVTDSFIYQYLVMYGTATQEGYESNPNRVLLWIYYIAAIFLTNVTFLNLLIAVMSTTYETVMETKQRGVLIERTRIYYEYIGALNVMYPANRNKLNRRYMYVAQIQRPEDLQDIVSIENSISSFKRDIRREVRELKQLVQQSVAENRATNQLVTKIFARLSVGDLQ